MLFYNVDLCEGCVSFYWEQNASILKKLLCKGREYCRKKKRKHVVY